MGTSPKNTKPEPLEKPPVPIKTGDLTRAREVTVVDLQVDSLQTKLEQSEDQRKEERFLWFMLSGVLLVSLIYSSAGVAAGSFVALIFVAMALVLSRRWGFDDLWEALHAAKQLIGFKNEKDEED